nr:immunoglobulin heavy chain junction region [Macaca mulatta]
CARGGNSLFDFW